MEDLIGAPEIWRRRFNAKSYTRFNNRVRLWELRYVPYVHSTLQILLILLSGLEPTVVEAGKLAIGAGGLELVLGGHWHRGSQGTRFGGGGSRRLPSMVKTLSIPI